MDRISRALEKARAKVPEARRPTQPQNKGPVEYTKTHTVAVEKYVAQENRIMLGIGDSPLVDTYGLLRTRVLKAMRQNNWKTLGITSPDPSVGKTVTALNLAISIGMDHNYSVLLVDADLRRPGIHRALNIEPSLGLNDYLVANKPLEDILLHPPIEHLVIVPTGKVEGGTSELLSSPKMTHFVEEAKQRYPDRIVLFDLPPVLVGDDVVALSQNLDALLLVVEDGKTPSDELASAIELLKDASILGVVLNKCSSDSNQYEYYYR
jgi:capsular exopolysaccharide synthesis family protein